MAREADPDLTYRQLQEKFKASSSIVADAIKGGAAMWASMLKGESSSTISSRISSFHHGKTYGISPQFIAIIAEPQPGRGDLAPFRYRKVGENEWHPLDAPGIDGMLSILETQGWELVYIARTGLGHGTTAFDGAYECIFKSNE